MSHPQTIQDRYCRMHSPCPVPCFQTNPAWTRNANVHLTRLLLEAVLHTSDVAMQVQLIETSRFHGQLSWLWLPEAVLFQMGRLGRLSHNGFSMVFPIIQWISVDHFGVPRKYGDPNGPKYRRAAVVDRSKGHLGCYDHWQEFQEATWPVDPHPGCSSSALCYFFLVGSRWLKISKHWNKGGNTCRNSCRCVFCYTMLQFTSFMLFSTGLLVLWKESGQVQIFFRKQGSTNQILCKTAWQPGRIFGWIGPVTDYSKPSDQQ